MSRIVFPEASEFILKKTPRHRALQLKHVIAVVYMFGGVSALLALISKFIVQPLYQQLTMDREEYIQLATKLMRDVNAKLTNLISTNPPVKVERNGKTYCDMSTQTETASTAKPKPEPMIKSERNLASTLARINTTTRLSETASTKNAIEGLSSLTTTLSFPQYGGRIPNFDMIVMRDSDKKKEPERDVQAEVMKEIRSIKGSLLSARNLSV